MQGRRQPTSLSFPYPASSRPSPPFSVLLQHADRILPAAQQCDPTTWSAAQLTNNNHVTAAKHSAADRRRLQGVLAGRPEIRRHLCALAEALGYADDPRCSQQPEQQQAQQQQDEQRGQPEAGAAPTAG